MSLDELEAAIARCDNLDWRIDYEEEAGVWCAWFHPDWQADPRRVIRVILADDEPSANEQACIQAMQLVMAQAPAMMKALKLAKVMVTEPPIVPGERVSIEFIVGRLAEAEAAERNLRTALAALSQPQ